MKSRYQNFFESHFSPTITLFSLFSVLKRAEQALGRDWSPHVNLEGLKTTYDRIANFWSLQEVASGLYEISSDVTSYFQGRDVDGIPPGAPQGKWLLFKSFFKTAKVISNAIGVGRWLHEMGAAQEQKSLYGVIEDLTGAIGHAGGVYLAYANREHPPTLAKLPAPRKGEYESLYYQDALWTAAMRTFLFGLSFFSLLSRINQLPAVLSKKIDDIFLFLGTAATVSMLIQHFWVALDQFKEPYK